MKKNRRGPAVSSTRLLDNSELSSAILQTFDIINRSSPNGPEITRAREHWIALLAERERRLSNIPISLTQTQGAKNIS